MGGDFAGAGNRIAFFEFAQAAFFYSSTSNSSTPQVYHYSNEWYSLSNNVAHREMELYRDYADTYNSAYYALTGNFSSSYVKYYTTFIKL